MLVAFEHKLKSLILLSRKFLLSFFKSLLFILTISGCSSTKSGSDIGYSEAWLQTQNLVNEFGQVSSVYHTNYLKTLADRLAVPFRQNKHPEIAPRIILLNTKQPMALWPGSNFVLISRGLILGLNTESELAFVIAHELSHLALGHSPISNGEIINPLTSSISSQELDADRMALGIVALAGYDPRSAIPALQNAYRIANSFNRTEDGSPSLETRTSAALEAIYKSKWTGLAIGDRREFHSFKNSLK